MDTWALLCHMYTESHYQYLGRYITCFNIASVTFVIPTTPSLPINHSQSILQPFPVYPAATPSLSSNHSQSIQQPLPVYPAATPSLSSNHSQSILQPPNIQQPLPVCMTTPSLYDNTPSLYDNHSQSPHQPFPVYMTATPILYIQQPLTVSI